MQNSARRPLKIRSIKLAQEIAQSLSRRNISPNQISVASVFCAATTAACFLRFGLGEQPAPWWVLLVAALFIQLRLLCNLFDGMVAIEGGKSTNAGELFNDIPDRVADALIFVSAGYAISTISWGSELGWCAALLSIMTAYIRTLGASIGAPISFAGPMAKQHRMALLTFACIATSIEGAVAGSEYSLLSAMLLIVAGTLITIVRRTVITYSFFDD